MKTIYNFSFVFFFTAFFFITPVIVKAQHIMGKVIDSVSRSPISSATLSLSNVKGPSFRDTVLIQSAVADSLGSYKFEAIPSGIYTLKCSMVGYQSASYLIVVDNSHLIVHDFFLLAEPGRLQAVTVYGKRPAFEIRNDGVVYNPANDLAMAGASAAELLKRIPILNVDQTGNLSIPGKMNIRVLIDNKPSDIYGSSVADALKQIPAADIEKVEVITSPSSKYEAEGSDAVILITTKKSRLNGNNGNIRILLKTRISELSAGLKWKKNSISVGLDAGYYQYHLPYKEQVVRQDLDQSGPASLVQDITRKNQSWSYFIGMSFTKMVDSLKLFSISYRFRDGKFRSKSSMINDLVSGGASSSHYTRNISLNSGNVGQSMSMGYTGKSLNKKNELNLLASFFSYHGVEDYDLDQARDIQIDHHEISRGRTKNRELSIQADDTYKLSDKIKVETGARAIFRHFVSGNNLDVYSFASDNYQRDEPRSNYFSYNRAIYAVYINYSFSIKQWELRMGARYEVTTLNTRFKEESLKIPGYSNLVPDFLLNRKIGALNNLRFGYKKNILRPYLHQINPNVSYIDSLNLSYGNPGLIPAIQHNFQVVHSLTKQPWFWSNTFFLNTNRNNVESIRISMPGGIMATTYQNIGRYMDVGIMTSISLNRQNGFNFNASANIRYVKLSSKSLQQSSDGITYGTNINISYRINKGFSIEGNMRLNSRTVYLQGHETRWKQHGLSINKKLFGEKLNITAGSDDFFSRFQKIRTFSTSGTVLQSAFTRYPSRIFRIGLNYNFGKKDLVVQQVRAVEE